MVNVKKVLMHLFLFIVLLLLLIPFKVSKYKDGGTIEIMSMSYKIVSWNKYDDSGNKITKKTIYFFPQNYKSIEDLWKSSVMNN